MMVSPAGWAILLLAAGEILLAEGVSSVAVIILAIVAAVLVLVPLFGGYVGPRRGV